MGVASCYSFLYCNNTEPKTGCLFKVDIPSFLMGKRCYFPVISDRKVTKGTPPKGKRLKSEDQSNVKFDLTSDFLTPDFSPFGNPLYLRFSC